jgi:hypothetical protein
LSPHLAATLHRLIRDAAPLDGDRARAGARLLAALFAAAALAWLAASHGLVDPAGHPIGTDFLSFHAAARLAVAGTPALAWDPAAHAAAEAALVPGVHGYWAFFYPPPFLLLLLPLGLLPYGGALALWLATTTAAALLALHRLAPRLGLVALAAAPALWLNAGHGQNGALSLALLAAGAILLDRRPFVAGLLLGVLVVKPHLAPAVGVALLAAGRPTAVVGAILSAALLCLVSLAVVGVDAWRAFLAAAPLARLTLESDLVGAHKMASVFAAARLLGAGLAVAYGLQTAVAVAVLAAVAVTIRRARPDGATTIALAAAAAPLVSPFLLDYDLAITLLPLALLVARAITTGFHPWEKTAALALFLWPLVGRALSGPAHLPLAPLLTLAVLVVTLRRAAAPERA